MQSTHELLDLVDENDQVIGQKLRTEMYAENRSNFRVVNAFVMNQNGQLWIPRRTAHKSLFPLCLDMSMGGHVQSGESYEKALQRELQEELNFDLKQIIYRELGYLSPHTHAVSAFMRVYEIRAETVPDYNREDFVAYYWLTPLEAIERIEKGDPAKGDLPKLIRIFYHDL
ncbi:nudix hydrolase [Reticulibacter mediterranei]|uniref:Nudix hydrolase n=1 Tax=Reticulibacter mediterranei TaxID=2778369 RepID=A0A8J3IF46_9CHLR|nr:NUDIX domain-containing protein [Reticulibacter mediterranei]GHO93266.1 nudix hydrolase [Reticulibacter mediterranei]